MLDNCLTSCLAGKTFKSAWTEVIFLLVQSCLALSFCLCIPGSPTTSPHCPMIPKAWFLQLSPPTINSQIVFPCDCNFTNPQMMYLSSSQLKIKPESPSLSWAHGEPQGPSPVNIQDEQGARVTRNKLCGAHYSAYSLRMTILSEIPGVFQSFL